MCSEYFTAIFRRPLTTSYSSCAFAYNACAITRPRIVTYLVVDAVWSRESTGTSTSDWDDDGILTTVTSSRPLMTSLSTDNLQQELARATCNSDGLSDKENVVQEMKHHVKYLPDNLTTVRIYTCILSTALVGRQEGHPACDNIASAMLSFGGLLGIGLSYIDLKLIRNRKSSPLVLENSIQSLIWTWNPVSNQWWG